MQLACIIIYDGVLYIRNRFLLDLSHVTKNNPLLFHPPTDPSHYNISRLRRFGSLRFIEKSDVLLASLYCILRFIAVCSFLDF